MAEDDPEAWGRRKDAEKARRQREEASWDARAAAAAERRDEWRRRWSLSLAIANAAALLGVSSVVIDGGQRPPEWQLLLPSAWLFVIGVACAGLIPLLRSLYFEEERGWAWAIARAQALGGHGWVRTTEDEEEDSDQLRKLHADRRDRFGKLAIWTERISAATFTLGLLLPLIGYSAMALLAL